MADKASRSPGILLSHSFLWIEPLPIGTNGVVRAPGRELTGIVHPEETEPTMREEVFDSPKGWVAQHIRRYVESDGRRGHRWSGVNTLLLTTRGRKSGKLRRTALIYGRDGDRYLVVGSSGGAKRHPSWYLNLVENPQVDVQVGPDTFTARADTATGKEKARLWRVMTSIWPEYDRYQTRTERDIPVVILERLAAS
jgi:deazaflavin-dependent oxidoreductase (nitroreductase family)